MWHDKMFEPPNEGKDFFLQCQTNDNWKICSWKRLSLDDNESCNFTYQQTLKDTWERRKSGCGHFFGFPEIYFEPPGIYNTDCTIRIKEANLELSGDWECELQRCNSRENEGCKAQSNHTPVAKRVIRVKVLF